MSSPLKNGKAAGGIEVPAEDLPPPPDLKGLLDRFRQKGVMIDRDDPALAVHFANEFLIEELMVTIKKSQVDHQRITQTAVESAAMRMEEAVEMLRDHSLKASLENTLAGVQANATSAATTNESTLAAIRALRTHICAAVGAFWLGIIAAVCVFIFFISKL